MKVQNIEEMKQVSTPAGNPDGGFNYLYFKNDDNLYKKDSAGVEVMIGGFGEANTGNNLWSGEDIFASKVWVDFQFKSLVAGTNITLSSDSDSVTIDAVVGMSARILRINRNMNDATATVVYTHNLWRTPWRIDFNWVTAYNDYSTIWSWCSSGQFCVFKSPGGAGAYGVAVMLHNNDWNQQQWSVNNVNATTFSISWTRSWWSVDRFFMIHCVVS